MSAKPPTIVDLSWISDLKFSGSSDKASITLDSSGITGPSPVQALGFAIAGCMTTDVAHMLQRGRYAFRGLHSHTVADRAPGDPHRFVRIELQITVQGDVPSDAVERAISLSRDKYCSVWHSMRQDIEFTARARVEP